MRFLTVTFCLLLVLGLAAGVTAQTAPAPSAPGSSTSNPETKADNPTDRRIDPAPQSSPPTMDRPSGSVPAAPDVRSEQRRDDSGSALPRTSTESTRVFGMNPTAAVLLAGAILIVVILAIVAMTRGGPSTDTRVDVDRRF